MMMSCVDIFKLCRGVDLLNKMLKVKSREMGKQESPAINFAINSPSLNNLMVMKHVFRCTRNLTGLRPLYPVRDF